MPMFGPCGHTSSGSSVGTMCLRKLSNVLYRRWHHEKIPLFYQGTL